MDDTDQTSVGWPSLSRRGLLQSVSLGSLLGLSLDATATASPRQLVLRTGTGLPALDESGVEGRKAAASDALDPLLAELSARQGVAVVRPFWLFDGALVEVDQSEVAPADLTTLAGVEWIHGNREFRIPEPQALTPDHRRKAYGLEQIGAPTVWDRFDTRGAGASVAVIDTGVDPTHPDIDIDPANFAAFDADGVEVPDPAVRDTSYHGTHVSGTATGGGASGRSIGVAPDATLYHALGLPGGNGTFAQIVAAVEWAVENGVDVANLSLGAPGFISELIEPVGNAVAAGTVVVAAAGNEGDGTVSTPGAVFEAFAVGASDSERAIAEFSSGDVVDTGRDWGRDAPDAWPEEYVVPDVAAPGAEVFSAFPEDADPPPGAEPVDEQWLELSGTSMAAPHVAGTVALMRAAAADVPASFGPTQTTRALSTTAGKPDDRPDTDIRYGQGIVDAVGATSRFAAESGVLGTVTDTDGVPVSRGTVSLDGFPVETAEDGAYRVRADAGEYDLEADGFGFVSSTQTVTVGDGFTTAEFELSRTLGAALTAGQPDGIEADGTFTVSFDVANVETYQVELVTEFEGQLKLLLNDERIPAGEPVPVDGETTLTLTVDPAVDARGEVGFEHTFTGSGETQTQATGPTAVFESFIEIAVVDRENGAFTGDVAGLLRENLDPVYEVTTMTPSEALSAAESASVAGFVVQSLGSDEALVSSFVEATAIPQLGVVYLQQSGGTGEIAEDGLAADGIHRRSVATGDPRDVVDEGLTGANPPVRYEITDESHQIIEDAGVEGSVTLYEAFPIQFLGGFHSYFEGFEGEVNGRTVANVVAGTETEPRPGLAVDDLSRTVLAASLGLSEFVGRRVFQSDAAAILASAAEYAATAPQVTVLSNQRERVAPGETVELELSVSDLLAYELTLDEQTTLEEARLSARLNGEPIAFGETVDTDRLTGEVTVSVEVRADAGERVALSHRFVTRGRRGGEETTTATTGPTAVYTPPLSVPGDVDSINEAVDIAVEGEVVTVDDGVYDEQSATDPSVGLLVDTRGLTLQAKRGADPDVRHATDPLAPDIIRVAADNVTLNGIDANVVDGAVDERNSGGSAVTVGGSTAGVTVRNAAVGGTFGVQLEGGASDVTVRNVTALQTVVGVGTSSSGSGTVEGATVRDVDVLDRPDSTFRGGVLVDTAASAVTVTDCTVYVEEGEVGIGLLGPFGGGEQCRVSGNEVVGDDVTEPGLGPENAGLYLDEIDTVVTDNRVEDTYAGIQVSDSGFGEEAMVVRDNEFDTNGVGLIQYGDYVTARRNVVDAATGLQFGDAPGETAPTLLAADAILPRNNDLSATSLPFTGVPASGFGDPDGPFDCRQNYVGERGYDDEVTGGDVAYDPFLTTAEATSDPEAAAVLGTDVTLDAGSPYGLGIPGPTAQTVWDVLGADGPEDFLGAVDRWDPEASRFRPVTDDSETRPLDGFRVTPGKGVRATIEFRGGEAQVRELDAGTHVLGAPSYGDDTAFETGTAEIGTVEQGILQPPGNQVGPAAAAERSPLRAYKIGVTAAGTVEPTLDAVDPDLETLLTGLGLDPTIHEDPGTPPATTDPLSFGALDRIAGEDPSVRAVGAALDDQVRQQSADGVVATFDRVLERARAEVDSAAAVRKAARRLLRQRYGVEVAGSEVPAEMRRVAGE